MSYDKNFIEQGKIQKILLKTQTKVWWFFISTWKISLYVKSCLRVSNFFKEQKSNLKIECKISSSALERYFSLKPKIWLSLKYFWKKMFYFPTDYESGSISTRNQLVFLGLVDKRSWASICSTRWLMSQNSVCFAQIHLPKIVRSHNQGGAHSINIEWTFSFFLLQSFLLLWIIIIMGNRFR